MESRLEMFIRAAAAGSTIHSLDRSCIAVGLIIAWPVVIDAAARKISKALLLKLLTSALKAFYLC